MTRSRYVRFNCAGDKEVETVTAEHQITANRYEGRSMQQIIELILQECYRDISE